MDDKKMVNIKRKPRWLTVPRRAGTERKEVEAMLKSLGLNTVCREANCPNYADCFSRKTATFMILGTNCTRNCRFCNVTHACPQPIDASEPENVALAAEGLGLRHVVVTSVTRDDLPDGGAAHFAKTVEAIKKRLPTAAVEVLIPDLKGDESALKTVVDSGADIIGHNMETVPSLYSAVRPQAIYARSLQLLRNIKRINPAVKSKTGIMLGLGEMREQVLSLLRDIRDTGCDFLTIGQYLPPSDSHYPLSEFVPPDIFDDYARHAREMGFVYVASAPLVRSSFHAGDALN